MATSRKGPPAAPPKPPADRAARIKAAAAKQAPAAARPAPTRPTSAAARPTSAVARPASATATPSPAPATQAYLLLLYPELRGGRRFKRLGAPTVLDWFRRHWRTSSMERDESLGGIVYGLGSFFDQA